MVASHQIWRYQVNECKNCGAPGGWPYCNDDCFEVGTAPEVPVSTPTEYTPPSDNDDPWATDARNYP